VLKIFTKMVEHIPLAISFSPDFISAEFLVAEPAPVSLR
jgi:hypothetical protein